MNRSAFLTVPDAGAFSHEWLEDPPGFGLRRRSLRSRHFGRGDDAVREIRQALELNPDAVGLNTHIGIALSRAGRKEEAADQIRKALAVNPNDADAMYQLAKILLKSGQHDEAMSDFDRFHVLYSGSAGIEGKAHEAYRQAGGGQAGIAAHCQVCLDDLDKSEREKSLANGMRR